MGAATGPLTGVRAASGALTGMGATTGALQGCDTGAGGCAGPHQASHAGRRHVSHALHKVFEGLSKLGGL